MNHIDAAEAELQQELREMFAVDTQQHLETYFGTIQQLTPQSWTADIQNLYRAIHTIKGGAVTVSADAMLHAAAALEDLLSDLRYLEEAPNFKDGELQQYLLEAGELLASTIEIAESGDAALALVQPTVKRISQMRDLIKQSYLPDWNELRQAHQEFADRGFDLVVLDLEMALNRLPSAGRVSIESIDTARSTLAQLTQIGIDLELFEDWTLLVQNCEELIAKPDCQLWHVVWFEYFQLFKTCAKGSGKFTSQETEELDKLTILVDSAAAESQMEAYGSIDLDDEDLSGSLNDFFADEDEDRAIGELTTNLNLDSDLAGSLDNFFTDEVEPQIELAQPLGTRITTEFELGSLQPIEQNIEPLGFDLEVPASFEVDANANSGELIQSPAVDNLNNDLIDVFEGIDLSFAQRPLWGIDNSALTLESEVGTADNDLQQAEISSSIDNLFGSVDLGTDLSMPDNLAFDSPEIDATTIETERALLELPDLPIEEIESFTNAIELNADNLTIEVDDSLQLGIAGSLDDRVENGIVDVEPLARSIDNEATISQDETFAIEETYSQESFDLDAFANAVTIDDSLDPEDDIATQDSLDKEATLAQDGTIAQEATLADDTETQDSLDFDAAFGTVETLDKEATVTQDATLAQDATIAQEATLAGDTETQDSLDFDAAFSTADPIDKEATISQDGTLEIEETYSQESFDLDAFANAVTSDDSLDREDDIATQDSLDKEATIAQDGTITQEATLADDTETQDSLDFDAAFGTVETFDKEATLAQDGTIAQEATLADDTETQDSIDLDAAFGTADPLDKEATISQDATLEIEETYSQESFDLDAFANAVTSDDSLDREEDLGTQDSLDLNATFGTVETFDKEETLAQDGTIAQEATLADDTETQDSLDFDAAFGTAETLDKEATISQDGTLEIEETYSQESFDLDAFANAVTSDDSLDREDDIATQDSLDKEATIAQDGTITQEATLADDTETQDSLDFDAAFGTVETFDKEATLAQDGTIIQEATLADDTETQDSIDLDAAFGTADPIDKEATVTQDATLEVEDTYSQESIDLDIFASEATFDGELASALDREGQNPSVASEDTYSQDSIDLDIFASEATFDGELASALDLKAINSVDLADDPDSNESIDLNIFASEATFDGELASVLDANSLDSLDLVTTLVPEETFDPALESALNSSESIIDESEENSVAPTSDNENREEPISQDEIGSTDDTYSQNSLDSWNLDRTIINEETLDPETIDREPNSSESIDTGDALAIAAMMAMGGALIHGATSDRAATVASDDTFTQDSIDLDAQIVSELSSAATATSASDDAEASESPAPAKVDPAISQPQASPAVAPQAAPAPAAANKRNIQIPVPLDRLDKSAQQVVDSLLAARSVMNISAQLQSQLNRLSVLTRENAQFVTRLRQLQDDYALLRNLSDDKQESGNNVTLERYRQGYSTINRLLENILRLSELGQEIESSTYQNAIRLEALDRSILQLKDGIETSRLVPFRNLTLRSKAIVRDLSNRYGKPAELIVDNEQLELDAGVVQQLEPALLHLLRNAYDHGLESVEQRLATDKPGQGRIRISLQNQGNMYRLTIADDGGGIDADRIRQIATAKGFKDVNTSTNADLLAVLCQPGFSSSDSITEVSGRGVGMDVVLAQITNIGGKLSLETQVGVGTTFAIDIPAPQLLIPCVLFQVGDRVVALPTHTVLETALLSSMTVAANADDSPCTRLLTTAKGEIPGYDLNDYWQRQPGTSKASQRLLPDTAIGIRTRQSEGTPAIWSIADDLIGQAKLLIAPLPSPLVAPVGLIGVSLQPDGSTIAILDPIALTEEIATTTVRPESTNIEAKTEESNGLPSETAIASSAPKSSTPTILVVDDAAMIRRRLEASLNTYGFATHTCNDGLEALNWLQSNPSPDLVITDVEMPNMDGFTLIDRARQAQIDIPILVVSSRLSEEWGKEARRLGATDYLNKGFSTSELIQKVNSLLGLVVS